MSSTKSDMQCKRNKDGKQEESAGNQIISALFLIGEVLLLWLRMFYEICYSTFRLIVPQTEKTVKGEIVLITGAGHGIGKELALQFSALGATVVCWDINKKNNEQTVKDIAEIGYTKAYAYECDVTSREQIFQVAEKVKTEVGNVTIIVNNAGIMPTHSLMEHTEKEIRQIFDINVLAHFWILETFLPSMLANNHGHVVAMSSMAGMIGLRNLVPYCASKFAVRGMMEALHEELRETIPNSNIKFTTIFPYMVDTGLCKNPRIRYQNLMALVKPKMAAKKIIAAVRTNTRETSIPEYMYYLNSFVRLFPKNVSIALKNFLDSGLDSDLQVTK